MNEKMNEKMNLPSFLYVDARVRYWEDSTVNGIEDSEDGDLIPLKIGESWCPVIDLTKGKIQNWPQGVIASIHYKVCDDGDYWLGDDDGIKRMKWRGNYVPDHLLCHGDEGFGDYIIFDVMEDGKIDRWELQSIDYSQWETIQS